MFTIEGSKFVSPGPPIAPQPQQQSVSEEVAPTTVVKKPHTGGQRNSYLMGIELAVMH